MFGSPFEADAQVSHLVRLGLADFAVSTDGDILTFGCPLTLYNYLRVGKKPGSMVRWRHTCSPDINKKSEEVVTTTCLTGCDYINRLKGMSIIKEVDRQSTLMEKQGLFGFILT